MCVHTGKVGVLHDFFIKKIYMSSKPFKMPGCIFIILHSLRDFVSGFGTTSTCL